MNKKSIYLIVLGIALVISGVIVEVVAFTERNEEETYSSLQKQMDFRQVVFNKFSDKYFTIEKVQTGTTSTHQLFKVNYNIKGNVDSFYIEALWQTTKDENQIQDVDLRSINKHIHLSNERNQLPDFIIIGVGSNPSLPKQLFVVPVNDLSSFHISSDFLEKYRKDDVKKNFFYHTDRNVLK
ncbi:MAG: hypothetical protein R6U85_03500 [Salinivirgaceae bacterium]